ncbi:MAG: 4Fe-4S dicluster domain-containing protein [Methyloversatilis discipulorum]|uniref:ferredoxin family protein n=1 Tax=Methyloversatilis discipulorum TaxID=1119528 RepID=UPI0026E93081|nr:ferredoxin family protein [Methyloversatilis discipulorum]MBV5287169.1 4Fe-4S dicluster domain-containing protein [Methyloversatilis discipulorum]
MTHVVTDNCRGCRYTDCVASCPVACFHVNEVRVYIDPAVCIDCSACIPACPVHAIVEEFDLAEDQQHWIRINAEAAQRYPVIRARMAPLDGADARRQQLGL